MLPPGSAEPGPFRSSRTPYISPIAAACTDTRYKRVVAVMGTQMGKTAGLLNVIGHKLDDDPAPVLYVGPTKSNIDGVIEPQVHQLLRQSPSLWKKTLTGRKAQKLVKRVAGVTLRLAWAGSPTELASQPAHTVLVDEVDRMEPIPGEGDPVTLAEARTATYPDGRVIITSSPTAGTVDAELDPESGLERWAPADPEHVESQVWKFWQEGTRFEWAVPCPHCAEYFVPRFKLLQWPKDSTPRQARRDARLVCPRCGGLCEESQKVAMNARGLYVAPGQKIVEGVVVGEAPDAEVASFWVSGLMSPWRTFGQCASEWVTAVRSGDQEAIRGKINTVFGELYRVGSEAPEWERVRERCQPYKAGELPEGVRTITGFVDVQKRRLVYAIRGWGDAMESWLLESGEIWGETDQEQVWQELAKFRERSFGEKRIARLGIDSGYRPGEKDRSPDNQIYTFCRRFRGWAVPTKGRDKQDKPVSPSQIDVTFRGKTIKNGLQLWHVDTDFFKSWLYARLEWPLDQPGGWYVPEDVTDDYCKQVTAEARVLKPSGQAVWIKVRPENHFLDCEAGNAAVAYSLGLNRRVPKKPAAPVAKEQPAAEPPQQPAPAPQKPARPSAFRMPRRPGFVRNWRR